MAYVCVCARVCVRVRDQGQACVLVLRAMQSRDVQQLLGGDQWAELCTKVLSQLVAVSWRVPGWGWLAGQCRLSMSTQSHRLSGCVSRMINPMSSVCSESPAGGAHWEQGGEGEAGQDAGALPLPGQARSAAEAVGGIGSSAGGAAEHGRRGHLQQDGLPGGHVLGHHETLRSHVSRPTVCRSGLSNTQWGHNFQLRRPTFDT